MSRAGSTVTVRARARARRSRARAHDNQVDIDEITLGSLEEARRRTIRVPEDLSVIGFDNAFLASRSAPPLTTIAQPLVDMGRLAVRSLLQLVEGQVVDTRHLELATHLVVRDSTARPGVTPR